MKQIKPYWEKPKLLNEKEIENILDDMDYKRRLKEEYKERFISRKAVDENE